MRDYPSWTATSEAFVKCAEAGLSVIPIKVATKKASLDWGTYAQKAATLEQVNQWALNYEAFAILCGRVSGNLEMLDFDENMEALPTPYTAEDFFGPWWAVCGGDVEKYKLPVWKSGGNGYGLAYRCETVEGSLKLAHVTATNEKAGYATAIETRGGWVDDKGIAHCGYFVAPPSLHPSGNRYEMISGCLYDIPTIPAEVRAKFLRVARELTRYTPKLETRVKRSDKTYSDKDSVIARYNASHSIVDCLLAHGYTEAGDSRMSRPGKEDSKGVSIYEAENVSFHWSSNDALNQVNGNGSPLPMDPFNVLWYLDCSGDKNKAFEQAKRDLGEWVENSTKLTVTFEEEAQAAQEEELEAPTCIPFKDLPLGWISDYTDLMTELTGSPKEFNRLAGLVALSTACARNYLLGTDWAVFTPNIYGVIIAPSSVFHKSTCIRKAEDVLKRAELQGSLLANEFSPEGLFKQLSQKPTGVVIRDEIGRLFSSHKIKYTANLKADITDYYDGRSVVRQLVGQSLAIHNPCLSIFGGTTPAGFFQSVTTEDWKSGFCPRWLFARPGNVPPVFTPGRFVNGELNISRSFREERKLADHLKKIASHAPCYLESSPEAEDLWRSWYARKMEEAYISGEEINSAFASRYTTYALKFSILFTAQAEQTTVSTSTMLLAIELAEAYQAVAQELADEREKWSVGGGRQQRVLGCIWNLQSKNKKPPTTGEILRFSNMKKGELEPILEKLAERGAIMRQEKKPGHIYHALYEKLPVGRDS